ncbi:MAG: sigma-70 family RNA polymerase sigma factor [Rhodospirillaceae bacterium]
MAQDGFETHLERQIPALRRYAYALTRHAEDADDLVQDCLERALSRRYLKRPDGDLKTWLFAILRNLYINAYHARRRRGVHVGLDDAPPQSAPAEQESGLAARDALAALDLLPEEQKSLLLLVGVEDFSYEQAARLLDIPLGTVMSRLSRARGRLRAILDADRGATLRRVK